MWTYETLIAPRKSGCLAYLIDEFKFNATGGVTFFLGSDGTQRAINESVKVRLPF